MKRSIESVRVRIGAALMALILGVVALPGAALATEVRSGDAVTVPADVTIEDDLIATGGTVTIAGRVTGDVYAFGQDVVVTGTVDGDLIAAAQGVRLDGSVLGDLRAAGQRVDVNGQVGKNVSAAAQRMSVGSSGRVGGSLLGVAETLGAVGPIGRGLSVGGGTLRVGGPIGGPVWANVENLTVEPGATIAGGLSYRAAQEASLPAGSVDGPVAFTPAVRTEPAADEPSLLNGLFDIGGLLWLTGSALLGAFALRLFPNAPEQVVPAGRRRPLQSFGLGLAVLVGAPVLGLVAAISLIGLPLTLALALLYGLALLLAWPAFGLFVGTLLAEPVRRGRAIHAGWLLLGGLVALHLVTHLPMLGGWIAFLGLVFGLGLLARTAPSWRRSPGAVVGTLQA